MSENNISNTNPPVSSTEIQRYQTFVWIQIFFLVVSIFAGGFNYTVWSMLDSSILIVSIGVSGLLFVMDDTKYRKNIFNTAIVLYLLAILDMAVNVLISGSIGWGW